MISQTAPYLMMGSAFVMLLLGSVHLVYTFHGSKLHPRDAELKDRMSSATLFISRETTMWKAWIGFNASHSFGAILFAAIYGYLCLNQSALLFSSVFLLGTGFLILTGYTILARKYWFSVPSRGIVLALVLYVASIVSK